MQKISGNLSKLSVLALKQFTILEYRINLAYELASPFFYLTLFNFFKYSEGFHRLSKNTIGIPVLWTDRQFFKSSKRTTFGFSGLGPNISPTREEKLQNAITTQKDIIKENRVL